MDFIPTNWKHVLRIETSQKTFLKIFYYNNNVTRKAKNFPKLSN